jgi:hypothetical protein
VADQARDRFASPTELVGAAVVGVVGVLLPYLLGASVVVLVVGALLGAFLAGRPETGPRHQGVTRSAHHRESFVESRLAGSAYHGGLNGAPVLVCRYYWGTAFTRSTTAFTIAVPWLTACDPSA